MADISKCTGKNCEIKEKCYRFMARDGYWQAYADFNKGKKIKTEKECKDYLKRQGIKLGFKGE